MEYLSARRAGLCFQIADFHEMFAEALRVYLEKTPAGRRQRKYKTTSGSTDKQRDRSHLPAPGFLRFRASAKWRAPW
jgi:hypothetical protein